MQILPQELRDSDIRESFRGYERSQVDELLERAAATIETFEHERRIAQVHPRADGDRCPAPAPDDDLIQRTLIVAQRAADRAIAEAEARAQQLSVDSEARARTLVNEAESTARHIMETERRRVEGEIATLHGSRDALRADLDALNADIDALTEFARDYRDRIRRAIDAEFERLEASGTPITPPARPVLGTAPTTFTRAEPEPEPASASASEPISKDLT